MDKAEKEMKAFEVLLNQIDKDWKKLDNCVLGHIIHWTTPQPLLSTSVNMVSWRTGEFSRSTMPSLVTASRAIRLTSVHFDHPTNLTIY